MKTPTFEIFTFLIFEKLGLLMKYFKKKYFYSLETPQKGLKKVTFQLPSMTSDAFIFLHGYLENIEHSIESSFTLKNNEIDDVLIKIRKFCPIFNQTTFLATQKSNLCQIFLLKSDFSCKKISIGLIFFPWCLSIIVQKIRKNWWANLEKSLIQYSVHAFL